MTISKAQAALARCESELRTLLAQAASSGDYDSLLTLTSWARTVAALGGEGAASATDAGKSPHRRKARATSYPRFERRGDHLVKIGWSKREKAEYEHKAPLESVNIVASAVKKKGSDGRIFQISGLLPCVGPDGETVVPDYQVYLIVAWWRDLGLLDQHGRQGYSIPQPDAFPARLDHACNELIET